MTGEEIKELRNKLDITQEELAMRLLVSVQTISKWERGKTSPHKNLLRDLERMGVHENQ